MKLATFFTSGSDQQRLGIVQDEGVIDLTRAPGVPGTMMIVVMSLGSKNTSGCLGSSQTDHDLVGSQSSRRGRLWRRNRSTNNQTSNSPRVVANSPPMSTLDCRHLEDVWVEKLRGASNRGGFQGLPWGPQWVASSCSMGALWEPKDSLKRSPSVKCSKVKPWGSFQ